ncbi:hypothetical protein EBR66_02400 [bacterium]|nr:hypothetical protein [bacterium]
MALKTKRSTNVFSHKKNSSKNAVLGAFDNIDVRKLSDIAKLTDHIKNNVVTLLLIYADWCGHCKTFKSDMWSKLVSNPNRKIAVAQINENMLSHSPYSDLKIDGYPSVSLIGKDGSAATVNDPDTGEASNALSNTRDEEYMTRMITSDPTEVMAKNSMTPRQSVSPTLNEEDRSAIPTNSAKKRLVEGGIDAVNDVTNNTNHIALTAKTLNTPPNTEDDIMDSTVTPTLSNNPKKLAKIGGSLYEYLNQLDATPLKGAPITYTAKGGTRKKKHHKKGTVKKRRHSLA